MVWTQEAGGDWAVALPDVREPASSRDEAC